MNGDQFLIRGLPPEIATVPHWANDGDDAWRQRWRDWAEVLKDYRLAVLRQALAHPAFAAEERARCAAHPEYFLAMYAFIYEPRDQQIVPEGWNPWAPFPHQVAMLHWLERMMASPRPAGDGVIEKSRDMGATWVVCLWCAHQWLFARTFSAGLISYKEELVDAPDPDSMFFKIRGVLGLLDGAPGLPPYLFDPEALGYDEDKHNRKLRLIHPRDRSRVIKGEPTTVRSGRGGRARFREVDEAAFCEDLDAIVAGQQQTTMHQLLTSSAYKKINPDFQLIARRAAEDKSQGVPGWSHLRLETWMHPLHDAEWIARERQTAEKANNLAGFEREVMIDYEAGDAGLIYAAKVERARIVPDGYDPETILYVGIDPGRRDPTAIVWASPVLTDSVPTLRWLGLYERAGVTADYFAHLLTGAPPEPGDDYWGFMGAEEEEVMAFFREAWAGPHGVEVVGDPAGDQKIAATTGSFYDVLADRSLALRRRSRAKPGAQQAAFPDEPVFVYFGELHKFNDHETRNWALHGVFDRGATYADNPRARRLREHHRAYRYQERGRETTTEAKPVHNEASHPVAASQYPAVWLDLLGCKRAKQERTGGRKPGQSRLRRAA